MGGAVQVRRNPAVFQILAASASASPSVPGTTLASLIRWIRRARRPNGAQPVGGAVGAAATPRAVTIDRSKKYVADLSVVMASLEEGALPGHRHQSHGLVVQRWSYREAWSGRMADPLPFQIEVTVRVCASNAFLPHLIGQRDWIFLRGRDVQALRLSGRMCASA